VITAAPSLTFQAFGVPKVGHSEAEWEDAAAYSVATARFVVADGATVAYQARTWSNLLVRGFLDDPFRVDVEAELSPWLHRRAAEWERATAADVEADAPYYLREARQRGSHATLMAVEIRPGPVWCAVAIGDSCLLHYRAGRLVHSFPIDDPDAFGYAPDLAATDHDSSHLAVRSQGELVAGDVLLAVTDAAAEWLLRSAGTADDPAPTISTTDEPIDELVHHARAAGALRNDDVAIVRCLVGDGASEPGGPMP
jgi:hypothetical protein